MPNPNTLLDRQIVQRDRQNAANAAYNDFAGELKNPVEIPLPTVDLAVLTLSASALASGASQGTVIGAIQNKSSGSTLSINPADGRFGITGSNLVKGATAITAGTVNVTVRETLETSLNSPRSTTFAIVVS